jgi:hypothetical protein
MDMENTKEIIDKCLTQEGNLMGLVNSLVSWRFDSDTFYFLSEII